MITKAVILAAGKGTRFLPYTKVVPKEMLPIIDTPAIDLNVCEAIHSGIKKICIVTNNDKHDLNHYFEKVALPEGISIEYAFQNVPLGTGDAVLKAEKFADGEPIAVMNGDDVMYTGKEPPVLAQLLRCYERIGATVIGVQCVSSELIEKYSSVIIRSKQGREIYIDGIVEKPKKENAPSCYAALGRYIVTPEIFDVLHTTKPSKINSEIILTDALNTIAGMCKCCAYDFEGRRYDLGSKRGYLEAVTEYALRSEEFGEWYGGYISELVDKFQKR